VRVDLARQMDSLEEAARERVAKVVRRRAMVGSCIYGLELVGFLVGCGRDNGAETLIDGLATCMLMYLHAVD
jgi:hypothetical protein